MTVVFKNYTKTVPKNQGTVKLPPTERGILQYFRKKETLLGTASYERPEADIGGLWLSLIKEVKRHRSYFFFLSVHKLFHNILTT